MTKEQIIARFGDKTDLIHEFSYSNKVKNIFGIRQSDNSIRVRVDNQTENDRILYFLPGLFGNADNITSQDTIFHKFGLPLGNLFCVAEVEDDEQDLFKVTSLNPKQNLKVMASMLAQMPAFVTRAHMKSYTSDTNQPESTNFGNDIRHYRLNYFKGELLEDTPLYLTENEKRSDNTQNVMTIDFIKRNFNAFISIQDVLAFKVNANTKMDIDLTVGVLDSRPEYFYRQVRNGIELLNETVPQDADCKC